MQGCNGLSSLWTIRSSYSSRAPLDSTAIDPITQSPNYHHETGKIENLSRANLCLAHGPLELDDDDLDSLKLDHLSWLCWLDEDWWIAPPYSTMGEPLFRTSSQVHCHHKGRQASSIWSLRDAPLELAHGNLDDDHHLMSSFSWVVWYLPLDASPWTRS